MTDVLFTSSDDEPLVFETLGAWFHLDPNHAGAEVAVADVIGMLDDWFGQELRFSVASSAPSARAYRRVDLDYISDYFTQLDCGRKPGEPVGDTEEALIAANLIKVGRDEFYVSCWD